MSTRSFDDAELRAAMTEYLDLAGALDEAAQAGVDERAVLELAEATSMAAMRLRRRLEAQGWTAPSGQRTTT